MLSHFRDRLTGMLGNFLEHYDMALFGLLAPFIAPLFFDPQDPVTGLLLIYGIIPLGMLTRPLGALFFGWIGDYFGRKQALCLSLLGMAASTVGIGCLPLYAEIGNTAGILLALGRMLQNFFAAGETTGGAIFVLEHSKKEKKGIASGFYGSSSLGGILAASALLGLFIHYGIVEQNWRFLFWLGGLCGGCGIFLRLTAQESSEYLASRPENHSLTRLLSENRHLFLCLVFAAGFTYTTYALPFTLMSGYMPLVTSFSLEDALKFNTTLLLIDFLLLPLFGWLADRYGGEIVLFGGAFGVAITGIPLFYFLDSSNLVGIFMIRLVFVICGVAFAAPYHSWSMGLVPVQYRYRLLSLSHTIGSQLIGASSSAICLWLFQKTGWVCAPGVYLSLSALLAIYAVRSTQRKCLSKNFSISS